VPVDEKGVPVDEKGVPVDEKGVLRELRTLLCACRSFREVK